MRREVSTLHASDDNVKEMLNKLVSIETKESQSTCNTYKAATKEDVLVSINSCSKKYKKALTALAK